METVVTELIALFTFDDNAKSPSLMGIELLLGAEDKRNEDVRAADDGAEDNEGRKEVQQIRSIGGICGSGGDLAAAADELAAKALEAPS
ncbi:hypothetical protein PsorP6_006451 [Peronosclerospora sorghi]|uniref:Uncharacterized protein n=1 Tax=Peronosclerospora sorghi TaxID=230839 RepID=A0ACC0W209_9STRA|nr:hypothetical protein PsorP6_006451 [Peronosclerospora sorghi]